MEYQHEPTAVPHLQLGWLILPPAAKIPRWILAPAFSFAEHPGMRICVALSGHTGGPTADIPEEWCN